MVEEIIVDQAEAVHVDLVIVLLEAVNGGRLGLLPVDGRAMLGNLPQVAIRVVRQRHRLIDDEPASDSLVPLHSGELLPVVDQEDRCEDNLTRLTRPASS